VTRRRKTRPARAHPSPAAFSVLLALLGAAAYFYSVLFVVGDGGVSTPADAAAARAAVAIAGALSLGALLLAVFGLRRPGARGWAALGLTLGAAFAAFAAFSLARS
jgi:protein-S-isoprenylcysteine O-methyltransferase Ste14